MYSITNITIQNSIRLVDVFVAVNSCVVCRRLSVATHKRSNLVKLDPDPFSFRDSVWLYMVFYAHIWFES